MASGNGKQRTTVSLPRAVLKAAERRARSRHVSLSSVISEAVQAGLEMESGEERVERVLKHYQRAFGGLTDDQMMILDGVIPEDLPK